MTTSIEKKQVVEKAIIQIHLESADEIQAFKNVVSHSEQNIYEKTRGYDFKLEKQLLDGLRKMLLV